jgi:hypothetical protein
VLGARHRAIIVQRRPRGAVEEDGASGRHHLDLERVGVEDEGGRGARRAAALGPRRPLRRRGRRGVAVGPRVDDAGVGARARPARTTVTAPAPTTSIRPSGARKPAVFSSTPIPTAPGVRAIAERSRP